MNVLGKNTKFSISQNDNNQEDNQFQSLTRKNKKLNAIPLSVNTKENSRNPLTVSATSNHQNSVIRLACQSEVEIKVLVPPPFSLIPGIVLRQSASAILSTILTKLMNRFLELLISDYRTWLADKDDKRRITGREGSLLDFDTQNGNSSNYQDMTILLENSNFNKLPKQKHKSGILRREKMKRGLRISRRLRGPRINVKRYRGVNSKNKIKYTSKDKGNQDTPNKAKIFKDKDEDTFTEKPNQMEKVDVNNNVSRKENLEHTTDYVI